MNDPAEAIVLAAGKGTRMNSDRPKVCHTCFGEAMIEHIVRSLDRCSLDGVTVVVGEGRPQVEECLPEWVTTVEQEKQLGTGHAVEVALRKRDCPDRTGVLVTCGDIPGVRPQTYRAVREAYESSDADLVLLTTKVEDPHGYGRVLMDESGGIQRIVEEKDADAEIREIDRINTGIMFGTAGVFREFLPDIDTDNEAGEYYLTDVIELVHQSGGHVVPATVEDAWEVTGINTRRQLVEFEREANRRRVEELFDRVTIHHPQQVRIGPWVRMEGDVTLHGAVSLFGEVSLGKGTRIQGPTTIRDATIGDGCHIRQSQIRNASFGREVNVGPYCHVRPGTEVGDRVRLGNYVEVKNSMIGSDTNIAHLSYVGDAEIGEGVNVGAGTITCNYDGYEKHCTVIEDNVFIGSNTELVAPLTIHEGSIVGAGTTVTRDVPPRSLALSRVDQENRENWVRDVWEPRNRTEDEVDD